MKNNPLKKEQIIKIFKSIKVLKLKIEKIYINNCKNRILAENIFSSINVPPFNNSAVDGYAIRNSDTLTNKQFIIIDKISAGENKNIKLKYGQTVRIFTGGHLPENADSVIMQENSMAKNNKVTFLKKPKKNENCRFAGEDIYKNQLVFKKGEILKYIDQGILASIGLNKIKVYKKITVGFFTTGNELKNPTEKLNGSQINNSNKYTLFSLISNSGCYTKYLGSLKDNNKKIQNSILRAIKKVDVIITTGGASVGDEDHIVNVIKKIGKIIFWKVAIKPGRPLAFGFIKNKPIICLPGNPVSVFLLFSMLIKSLLFRLMGSKWNDQKSFPAKINFNMKKKTERMEWLRVTIDKNTSNDLLLKKYPKQGSGILSSIAFSDGIIEIPEDKSELKPGDVYNFYPNDSLF